MLARLLALLLVHDLRHADREQAGFQLVDRQHVAIAHHEVDVVERDAFRREDVVDRFLEEAGGVLTARDPLLGDRVGDLAVAQQAGAHVVVVGVNPEDVGVFVGHRIPRGGDARRWSRRASLAFAPRPANTRCGARAHRY